MNAEGLLRKQGWRGAGFSLDQSDRGIKKPLLISHKQDQLGLGKKKASHTTDDQWWMRAFDESLQNLGTGQKTTLSQIQEKGINRGGLYGFFVKGEGLQGSIGDETSAPTSDTTTPPTSTENESTDDSDSDSECTSSSGATPDIAKMRKPNRGQNKRKREAEEDTPGTKKLKQDNGGVQVNARAKANADGKVQTGMGSISADEWSKMCAVTSRINKQAKAKVKKNEKAGVYGAAANVEDPKTPSKQLSKKAAKMDHQKVIRSAKKQMVKELVVEAIVNGDLPMLNPEHWSKEDILQNYGKIGKGIKAVENANKLSNKTQREAKREQRKAAKGEVASMKARSKFEAERQSAVETHLTQLPPAKQVDYAARAAEKGQTLEEYTLRRIEKKEAKHAGKELDKKDAKRTLDKTKADSDNIAPYKVQKKAQRELKKEQKDKSAKLEGKLKTKQRVSQKAKTKHAEKSEGKPEGTNEERVRDTGEDKMFMEKAARFGAVARPIVASA